MTLGATPTVAEVVAELGQSFPYTFPDARTRWLADVGVSDPITFPTSFANKMAVKIVDTTALEGAASTSHSISANFGADFTGRWIVAVIYEFTKPSGFTGAAPISGVTIAGISAPGNDTGAHDGSGTTGLVGCGIFRAQPTGTSGTVAFTTTASTRCQVVVLSIAGYDLTTATDNQEAGSNGSSITSIGVSLNIPTNGLQIVAGACGNASAVTWSGVTERDDASPVANHRRSGGFDNRMTLQTARPVSITGSASTIWCIEAFSFPAS